MHIFQACENNEDEDQEYQNYLKESVYYHSGSVKTISISPLFVFRE